MKQNETKALSLPHIEYLKVTGDVSGFKTHLQVKQK
jgi:hypothetical protein